MTFDPSSRPDDDILARTIRGEADNQGPEGKKAVANVVMNRVANPGWWGTDVKSVCLHPFQFSCWNQNDPNRARIEAFDESDPLFVDALDIARKAISGELPDITQRATCYQVIGTNAPWSIGHTPCVTIGQHEFFNDIP
jgi:N-acetylmuramoyl-L-alanine amidase